MYAFAYAALASSRIDIPDADLVKTFSIIFSEKGWSPFLNNQEAVERNVRLVAFSTGLIETVGLRVP